MKIIYNPADKFEVIKDSSIYCPKNSVYIVKDNEDFVSVQTPLATAERELNKLIKAYENVLKGLNYWRERALAK